MQGTAELEWSSDRLQSNKGIWVQCTSCGLKKQKAYNGPRLQRQDQLVVSLLKKSGQQKGK